jgi:hypothetical protein
MKLEKIFSEIGTTKAPVGEGAEPEPEPDHDHDGTGGEG